MNLDRIEALLQLASEANVSELHVEGAGWRVVARKGAPAPRAAAAPAEAPLAAPPAPVRLTVTAPLVGQFRPADPPPAAGEPVGAGQVLGHIESMGILTPVVAPEAGRLLAAPLTDGEGVEFGQGLFEIAPLEAGS